MYYRNRRTGLEIKLDNLAKDEEKIYQTALEKYKNNEDWWQFHDFAFSMDSLIHFKQFSERNIIQQYPLYRALKDMWLELGIKQGKIRDED
jgi:hypothetical protein